VSHALQLQRRVIREPGLNGEQFADPVGAVVAIADPGIGAARGQSRAADLDGRQELHRNAQIDGRALQHAPQKAWSGKTENVAAAQAAFAHRARMNSLAALGKWTPESEKAA